MRVLLNRKPVDGPWGGGNAFVKAFIQGLKERGHEVVFNLEENHDCFFIIDPRPDANCPGLGNYLQRFGTGYPTPIIQRINECDARKNTEHMDYLLLDCSQYLTKTIFVSDWMKSYFLKKGWRCANNFVIHNGVDKSIFKPSEMISFSKKKSVVAHHWSNNILKGFDAYEFLDYLAGKGIIDFTYIGRHRNSFQNAKLIEPCSGEKLANSLAIHDIYVSASRFDPGPNHILEALAVGLPTYVHRDGGGAVEFAGGYHVFSNLCELEEIILKNSHEKNHYNPTTWEQSIEQYIRVVESCES